MRLLLEDSKLTKIQGQPKLIEERTRTSELFHNL